MTDYKEYIYAIYQEKSFSKAAKKLYDRGYSMVVAFADGGTLGRVAREQVELFRTAYPER